MTETTDIDPHQRLCPNRGDPLHDQQLHCDVQAINEQTLRALGPLPPGGMPVQSKRKPNLPKQMQPTMEATTMTSVQMPPVPIGLREMLKDYPDHIERLQQDLNWVIEHPASGIPPFERAIWVLEGRLETFISEARKELDAAVESGDKEAISLAEKKEHLMLGCRMSTPAWKIKDLIRYFDEMRKESRHDE